MRCFRCGAQGCGVCGLWWDALRFLGWEFGMQILPLEFKDCFRKRNVRASQHRRHIDSKGAPKP